MNDLYESFICNHDIMTRCNPFSMYYLVEHAKSNPKLKAIHRYQSNEMLELKNRFLKMRLEVRNRFLKNPCFHVFTGMSPAHNLDHEWIEIVSHFSEAIHDHLIYIRGVQVEHRKGYKELFKSRMMVLRTPFEDRLQLIFDKDVDETT